MLYFLFSVGIFECIFLAALLFVKRQRTISDNILAAALLVIGANIFFSYLESYNHEHDFAYSWMINISSPLVMLHGPLLWFYCRSLTMPKFRFKSFDVVHLVPFLVLLIYHYVAFYSRSAEEKIALARSESFASTFIYNFLLVCMIIIIFSYIIRCILLIRQHERRIKDIFSNTENIDLGWLKMVFFGALLTYVVTYSVIITNEFYHFTTFKLSEAIGYCLATILISVLGFYGIKQTQIFTSANANSFESSAKLPVSSTQIQVSTESVTRITTVMESGKPYLDPELTLKKLAELTRFSEIELSSILNNEFKKNFFDFVNTYRIEEFKKKLTDPANKNLTLLGIATNCGFNSKATFNRVFKNYTQLTPKAFKQIAESETSFKGK